MDKLVIVCVAIFFLLIILGLIIYISYSRKKTYNELREKYKKELEEDLQETSQKLAKTQEELTCSTNEAAEAFSHLQSILKDIDEKKEFNETLYKLREEELDNLIETKKQAEIKRISKEINEWSTSAQEAATFCFELNQGTYKVKLNKKKEELDELTATIDDYKARRDVINQEILRARAIEEKQDFYRIQLPDSSRHDLDILQSVRKELTKVDILDKLIYDNYVKKSVDEMVKRVLQGENPSGIYKITRLKTGEIYIGKSVNIKDRWIQHAKSCYHCGTISHSILHTTLEKDGIENFTWELLEKVPKDKLGEKEKYWIEFYDSKNFGLNEKAGG